MELNDKAMVVVWWQNHPREFYIFCQKDLEHGKLFPILSEHQKELILKCPKCDYYQTEISEEILKQYQKDEKTK